VIDLRAPRPGLAVAMALLAVVAVSTPTPAQQAAEIPVVTTPAGEFQPARSDGVLAWERNTRARPNTYEVVVRPDGGQILRVNRGTASAALGDILDGNVVYQQYRGNPRRRGRSSLYVFNMSSGQRSRIPGVNSPQWEYWPSASGDWLLFARWNPGSNMRRLLLHNLDSGERRILDKLGGRRSFLGPGQVNGNYAVWYACRPRCEVFRYDIATRTRTAIGNPGAGQRAPSVTRGGTVYFSRGGRRCGRSVTLVRESLQGEQSVLLRLPDGLDIADTYVHEDPGGVTEVYYERNVCRRPAGSDIYKIREPSLATLTVTVTGQGTVVSTPAGINCEPDCTEDYEVGTTVTLAAHPAPGWNFAGWGGACTGSDPCQVQMDSAKDVTATFDQFPLPGPPLPRGSITVRTEADQSDGTSFEFQTEPNISGGRFSLRDGESRTFGELDTGTYAVEELRMEDWDVEEIRCTGGGNDTEREQGGRTARIGLDPGEAARCTFFNEED
jgi:hypothetical protein